MSHVSLRLQFEGIVGLYNPGMGIASLRRPGVWQKKVLVSRSPGTCGGTYSPAVDEALGRR